MTDYERINKILKSNYRGTQIDYNEEYDCYFITLLAPNLDIVYTFNCFYDLINISYRENK